MKAGMSTRAIAPIVGTSHKTVVKDAQAMRGGTSVPPERTVNTETGDVSDDIRAHLRHIAQALTERQAHLDAMDAALSRMEATR